MAKFTLLLAACTTVAARALSSTSPLTPKQPLTPRSPSSDDQESKESRRSVGIYHAELIWTTLGSVPGFHVHLGGDRFSAVEFLLGSSVFWVPGYNWHCVDDIYKNLTRIPQDQCPDHSETTSPDFTFSGGRITDAGFNSTFNAGSYGVAGILGHQKVTVGDLVVPDAVTGISTLAHLPSSFGGVMGFGFPYLTAQWSETELNKVGEIDRLTEIKHYNPVIFQAAADGLIDPVFGYYYDDMGNPDGTRCGEVTFGGEPRIASGPYSHNVPVVPRRDWRDSSKVVFDEWNIHLDGFKIVPKPGAKPISYSFLKDDKSQMLVSKSNYRNHTATVSTGIQYTTVPDDIYSELLKHIHPTPKENEYGNFATDCDATVPQFAVTIGGSDFWFNRSGIVYPPKYNPDQKTCELGILNTGGYTAELGSTFLINVVAVHNFADLSAPSVKFAQRVWS